MATRSPSVMCVAASAAVTTRGERVGQEILDMPASLSRGAFRSAVSPGQDRCARCGGAQPPACTRMSSAVRSRSRASMASTMSMCSCRRSAMKDSSGVSATGRTSSVWSSMIAMRLR
ncbi:Uncharacterised protein [Mycobacteroides abscessus subsp. abscessus]|nr:Uncharacterised protein [Mycobacteroides abscessus subsp. abscessus]